MAHSKSHSHGHEEIGHVVPESTFLKILIALLVLTIITVAVAQIDLGELNILGAMIIASVKASLVILVFMHGKYENKILWTYIAIPFILLVIMIGGVFTDDPFRDHPVPFGKSEPSVSGGAHTDHASHGGHH